MSDNVVSEQSVPSWIENILMNDDVTIDSQLPDGYLDDFLSDVLLDSPTAQSDLSDSTPKESDTPPAQNDDDPNSKKRKRQLRNKDAALRSRERKKEYVKDLEVKSRYLEGEVRRLGRMLQCCYAENHDLRFRLHMSSGNEATMTKQESAVLVMESLLLGSLFWFLGIMCLFYLPNLLCLNQGALVLQGIVKRGPRSVHQIRTKSSVIQSLRVGTLFNSRRCRALRIKMKPLYTLTSNSSILSDVG